MNYVNQDYDNTVPSALVVDYLDRVGSDSYIKMANADLSDSNEYYIGEEYSQTSLYTFYVTNKEIILDWLIDSAPLKGYSSVLRYVQNICHTDKESKEDIYSLDNISEALYGKSTESFSYGTLAMLIAKQVIRDIAEAYREANSDFLEIRTPTEIAAYLADFDGDYLYSASIDMVTDYLNNIGIDKFISGAETDSDRLSKFYKDNRAELLAWFKRYVRKNDKCDVLEHLERELNLNGSVIDIDSIALIIHGNNKFHVNRSSVTDYVAKCFGDALKNEYLQHAELNK